MSCLLLVFDFEHCKWRSLKGRYVKYLKRCNNVMFFWLLNMFDMLDSTVLITMYGSHICFMPKYILFFWTKISNKTFLNSNIKQKNPKNWKTILSYLLFFNVMNIRLFVRVSFSPFVGTFFFVKGLFHLCHHKDLLLPRNFNLNIWIYIHKHIDSEEKSKIFRKTNSV